jgi:outer membrane protein assembly factor BamB
MASGKRTGSGLFSRHYAGHCLSVTILLISSSHLPGQVDGSLLWSTEMGGNVWSSPAIGRDGTIYAASTYEDTNVTRLRLVAVTPQGTRRWVRPLGPVGAQSSSPAIGRDGTIYAGQADKLYAVSPAGVTNWIFTTGDTFMASPAIGLDGVIYIHAISTNLDRLFAISPGGATNWIFTLLGATPDVPTYLLHSSPAIGPDGTIYVATGRGQLAAITPRGDSSWIFGLGAGTYLAPTFGADGTIYIGAEDGTFFAINSDGGAKWIISLGKFVYSPQAAVGSDGTIYVSALGPSIGTMPLRALDPDGIELAVSNIWGTASPAVVSGGRIYLPNLAWCTVLPCSTVGSPTEPEIWALDSPSLTKQWTFHPPYLSSSHSSPAIGPDGTIYFGSGTKLYALSGTNLLQKAPWPMFGRNPAHEARAPQRPVIQAAGVGTNGFSMTLTVEPDEGYVVEASTDLLNWMRLTNFTATTVTNFFVDVAAAGFAQRFYRLRPE